MSVRILQGDVRAVLQTLRAGSIHCIVTSPPYWGLRDYGVQGQIGLEETPEDYVRQLVGVFREARRVLRDDGTLWLNLGDCYAGSGKGRNADGSHTTGAAKQDTNAGSTIGQLTKAVAPHCKPKDLLGLPWAVVFALREDGWWLRSEIVWHKPNPMPESVRDRPSVAHEKIFLLTKSAQYFYDAAAVRQPPAPASVERWAQSVEEQQGSSRANAGGKTNGPMKAVGGARASDKQRGHGRRHAGFNDRWDGLSREERQAHGANLRNVWTIATSGFKEAHFATFPEEIPLRCIKAGCPSGGTVLDPFAGSGTTGLVADRLGRDAILIELNPSYAAIAERRVRGDAPLLADVQHQAASERQWRLA